MVTDRQVRRLLSLCQTEPSLQAADNRWLKAILAQTAWAATHTKGTYLASQYHLLAGRRGRKQAIVAVGRRQLVCACHMLRSRVERQDLGEGYFDRLHTRHQTRYHVTRLDRM